MKIKKEVLPRKGDYYIFKVEIWEKDEKQLTFLAKLTETELKVAQNRKCISSIDDAYLKMENFAIKEAKQIYQNGDYTIGIKVIKLFSPCW